jgi:hypothetical protein
MFADLLSCIKRLSSTIRRQAHKRLSLVKQIRGIIACLKEDGRRVFVLHDSNVVCFVDSLIDCIEMDLCSLPVVSEVGMRNTNLLGMFVLHAFKLDYTTFRQSTKYST